MHVCHSFVHSSPSHHTHLHLPPTPEHTLPRDNAKKYIEKQAPDSELQGKGSDIHKAAVVGDTVGDPLKDTSGPSLNILMKLMAIISLVRS